jgi:hypothetical protein
MTWGEAPVCSGDKVRRRIPMFEKMSTAERIQIAQEKTRRVVDHLHYLLDLHENNAIVLYTDALSKQIPTSFAANASTYFGRARTSSRSRYRNNAKALWEGCKFTVTR